MYRDYKGNRVIKCICVVGDWGYYMASSALCIDWCDGVLTAWLWLF